MVDNGFPLLVIVRLLLFRVYKGPNLASAEFRASSSAFHLPRSRSMVGIDYQANLTPSLASYLMLINICTYIKCRQRHGERRRNIIMALPSLPFLLCCAPPTAHDSTYKHF